MIKLGPSGLGSFLTIEKVLQEYKKLGFKICEIAFTHSIYLDSEKAKKLGELAKKYGIDLSIHSPYYVNLNSDDPKKIEASKKRILKCAEIGELMGAKIVVFHPGYYGNFAKEQSYENIKSRIQEMQDFIYDKRWKIKLAPETMGKVNVFGSVEDISNLVKDTNCSFCIDFAHILARDKKVDFEIIKKSFPWKDWHCHFSGIEYNEKGERFHKNLEKKQWKDLFENLPKNKDISIICESPDRIDNCIEGLELLEK